MAAILEERLDATRRDNEAFRADLGRLTSQIEKQNEKSQEFATDSQMRTAVLETKLEELRKRWEESDRRRWTIYGVMLAAVVTFIANLVLLLLRK